MIFTDTVECPYCEHDNDMTDGLTDLPDSLTFDTECEECEKEFEVEVEFYPDYSGNKIEYEVRRGEKIAQLVISPIALPQLEIVDQFHSQSERGEKGFGSSDEKVYPQ